jgi:hypothetical protein
MTFDWQAARRIYQADAIHRPADEVNNENDTEVICTD